MAGYGSDAGLADWLADNGLTLPVNAPAPAVIRQRGSAYVDGVYGSDFPGVAAGGYSQERAWPRAGARVQGGYVPDDVIPVQIEHAAYFAGYQDAITPGVLEISAATSGAVKRRKIDTIEIEYASGSGDVIADGTKRFSVIEGLLAAFLVPAETGIRPLIFAVG